MKDKMTIALAGNPNSGKTSIFNNLTGARQHVGNWPGVTVEKKEGRFNKGGCEVTVIDLPGTYSLGAYSLDEVVARDFILSGEADVVVNIVDATNLERNLYLTTQLIEMGANVVVALNIFDEAEKKFHINVEALGDLLGVPVIPTVAPEKKGIEELEEAIFEAAKTSPACKIELSYGREIRPHLQQLIQMIEKIPQLERMGNPRWLALKLLEEDEHIRKRVEETKGTEKLLGEADKAVAHITSIIGDDPEVAIADHRYGFISSLLREVMHLRSPSRARVSVSDKIDKVLTNRFLGLPIFVLVAWGIFEATFRLAEPLVHGIEVGMEYLGNLFTTLMANAPQWATSLVVDGIVGGLGNVLVFLPNIFLLFLAISLLEDSGYMARVAYIMDHLMHKLGLHGRSFIPMLIGFGCNVPAIMATRTLDSRRDRMITIMVNPLMSCSARLPVYVLFVGAFFTKNQGTVILSLYLLGIFLAIVLAKLFGSTIFKGESSHFVMELPPYRLPTIKGTFVHMWERGRLFLRRAGGIIFAVVIVIWSLSILPYGVEFGGQDSLAGKLGGVVAPIFAPAGFNAPEASIALIFGFVAKEVVVGSLGVMYGVGEEGLAGALQQDFTPLSAYAFLVMILIYVPCMATVAVIRRETNSWPWTFFAVGYSMVLGWVVATLVYQGGLLLGFS